MTATRVPAVLCFGVPETVVDEIVEAVLALRPEATRWIVAGLDMVMIGALVTQWDDTLELTFVRVPDWSTATVEALVDIVLNEGLEPDRVIWLHAADGPPPPDGFPALSAGRAERADRIGDRLAVLIDEAGR